MFGTKFYTKWAGLKQRCLNKKNKAGDVGFERQMLSIDANIRNNPAELRNNWYSKFNERKEFVRHYKNFKVVNNPVFEFPFSSFFSYKDFCVALADLATFLNQTFFPDQSLYQLWSTFIKVNQGWQSYIKCDRLLNNIFANEYSEIDCTVVEQGWLNYNLSKICRLYDGVIFEQAGYPTNTQTIHTIVQEHINKLRN